jgi:glutamate carboxypeptidase
MIGHLDTVFEPDSPFQKYERLSESKARGPGVSDMKGGNVIILEALRALNEVGALDRMTVTVILIGDEESSGRPLELSRKVLLEAAEAADIALAFENGDDQLDTAVIARRGYTGWKLEVTGKPGHSSQVFKENMGYGAIYEAARILSSFYQELEGEENLTFNPGVIVGGTTIDYDAAQSSGTAFGKSNVIAERTTVAGDLRTLTIEQRESAKDRMRAIVSQHLNGATAEITFSDGYPPLGPTDGNRRLLSLLDQTSRDLGFGGVSAVDPSQAGAADVSFTAGLVDMALDGLGLLGADNHTVHETADLSLLPIQAKRAAILMHRVASTYGTE